MLLFLQIYLKESKLFMVTIEVSTKCCPYPATLPKNIFYRYFSKTLTRGSAQSTHNVLRTSPNSLKLTLAVQCMIYNWNQEEY